MALKIILESLDSVDAALHEYYKEVDGKFILQVSDIKEHPDTQALKAALDRVRAEKKEAVSELDAIKDRVEGLPDDFDGEAYEALRSQAEDGGGDDPDEKVQRVRDQYERKIANIEKKHATELGKRDETITKQRTTLERTIIDGGLSAAMDEANIDPRHKKKLAPYLKSIGKITLQDDEGDIAAIVETDMGEVSLARFVADWAGSDDGKEYVGKPAGLDAKGSDGRRMEGNPFAAAAWNKTDQGRLMQSDRSRAERMAKAAGFRDLDAAAAARQPVQKAS